MSPVLCLPGGHRLSVDFDVKTSDLRCFNVGNIDGPLAGVVNTYSKSYRSSNFLNHLPSVDIALLRPAWGLDWHGQPNSYLANI